MPKPLPEKVIESWGRIHRTRHLIAQPRHRRELDKIFALAAERDLSVLGHGLGRSYGDSNQNSEGLLLDTPVLDRFIAFDRETGLLRVEAGVSLGEILEVAVPAGYFLATTPGTRFVTIAGAIANDVHGKNHHRAGCFSESVKKIGLIRSDGTEHTLSRDAEGELFAATIGGLGLTGLISWVELQLVPIPSAYIDEETLPFSNLDAFFALAADTQDRFEHAVAWIDCTGKENTLGRGVLSRGNWSATGRYDVHNDRGPTIPVELPSNLLNPLTLKVFNRLYRVGQSLKPTQRRVHYSDFFYPLDSIGKWNRVYGAKGFHQYQAVFPSNAAQLGVQELLSTVQASGEGSMLAVLKLFGGKSSAGLLSFPLEGATLALDFRNRGPATLDLFSRLDEIVLKYGGRLYPAKDSRMSSAMFKAGFPAWSAVEDLRDPRISSEFWRRVTA